MFKKMNEISNMEESREEITRNSIEFSLNNDLYKIESEERQKRQNIEFSKVTFKKFAEQYLRNIKNENTRSAKASDLKKWVVYLDSLKIEEARQWLALTSLERKELYVRFLKSLYEIGLKRTTVIRVKHSCARFHNYIRDYIDTFPTLPSLHEEADFKSYRETRGKTNPADKFILAKLIRSINRYNNKFGRKSDKLKLKAIFSLIYYGGGRRVSEVIDRIEVEKIDFENNLYEITPLKKRDDQTEKTKPLHPRAKVFLRSYIEKRGIKSGKVFKITARQVQRIMKMHCELIGLDINISPHSFRVGARNDMEKKGANKDEIKFALDWKSDFMVDFYDRKSEIENSGINYL